MEHQNVIDLLKSKGVNNPENPTSYDMAKIFGIFSSGQNDLNKDIFKNYAKTINPSIDSVIDGLKSFANAHVSKEYIQSVNIVIETLKKDYEKASIEKEKDKLYSRIQEQLDRIKQESVENREWLKTLGKYGVGAAVIIGGVGLAIVTRNTDLLKRGLQTFK
jgi:hypothetical protein